MATSRDYSRAFDDRSTEDTSSRVKDRSQIYQILSQVGLNPSDYTFSPLPHDQSSIKSPTSQPSAFSTYSAQPISDQRQSLKPQSQSLFTSSRPLSYVQQPAPPNQPSVNKDQASTSQTSTNQQPGSSFASLLFGRSAPNTQNTTTSQPPPPPAQSGSSFPGFPFGQSTANTQNTTNSQPPPPPAQSGSSFPGFPFGQSTSNTQNTTNSQPPAPSAQSKPSLPGFLLGSSAPNTQNTSSESQSNMNRYNPSPRRTPPPPPHLISRHDPCLSAEHYLREINSCDHPPVRVVKPSTQNVVYRKEIRIRYLQPPTPPPPAPIIIREKHIPARPPESPLLIRERKPEARTPPPLTIRERPPTPPPPLEPYVIEKNLPPPPPQPRQIIIERLPTPPPKPRTVIFEKWLPYKKVKRPVLLQKAPPREPVKAVRNVVIEYEPLKAFTVRRVIEEGVFRVDPHQYTAYNAQSHSGRGDVRIVERIEDLPPPSEQLMRVLEDYNLPVRSSSSHLNHCDHHQSHHSLSEHIPSNIQHLLSDARPASNIDQLTNVSRASSAPAYRQERVLSTGHSSSAASPTVVPIQHSRSKQYSGYDNAIQAHASDIY